MTSTSTSRRALSLSARILACAALSSPLFAQATLNVPASFPTIQSAIDAAANGDTVLVAPGLYFERINFAGTGNLIAKDITVRSSAGAASTVIDASTSGVGSVVRIANSANITILTFDAELDGFTVRGGSTSGSNGIGGGMVLGGGNGIRIRNCIVEGCVATGRGGGIVVSNGGVLIENTVLRNNVAGTTGNGGGAAVSGTNLDPNIGVAQFVDCVFEGNEADGTGGAVHVQELRRASFLRCAFVGNRTTVNSTSNNGGAISVVGNSSITVDECLFVGNLAPRANGGGLFVASNSAAAGTPIAFATVRNSKFFANNADFAGGALMLGSNTDLGDLVQPTRVINCVLASNIAGRVGGGGAGASAAVFAGGTSNVVELINCTIENNLGLSVAGVPGVGSAVTNGGAAALTVANCIVRNNQVSLALAGAGSATTTLRYSNVSALLSLPLTLGPGNIDAPALYTDADGADNVLGSRDDDYSLAALSAGIDAGENAALPAGTLFDLAGLARRLDDASTPDTGGGLAPIVDMGAYERQPVCALQSYCTAGTTTNGCLPAISGAGTPSVSAASGFVLSLADVEGQKLGLFFYGVSGAASFPWGAGSSFLCVKAPTQRLGAQNSGGLAGQCNGSFAQDFNAFLNAAPGALGQPFAAGDRVWVQAWFRDPPASKTTNLSNGVTFEMCP